jgi:hypothetical protein
VKTIDSSKGAGTAAEGLWFTGKGDGPWYVDWTVVAFDAETPGRTPAVGIEFSGGRGGPMLTPETARRIAKALNDAADLADATAAATRGEG